MSDFHPLAINILKLQNYNFEFFSLEEIVLFEFLIVKGKAFGFKQFYHSTATIQKETGLKRNKQDTIFKKFTELGILEIEIDGYPKVKYFTVNFEQVEYLLPKIYQFVEINKLNVENNKLVVDFYKLGAENSKLLVDFYKLLVESYKQKNTNKNIKEEYLKEKKREGPLARPCKPILKKSLNTGPPGKKNAGAEKFISPTLEDVKEFFKTDPGIPIFWPQTKRETEAVAFFYKYEGNGWKQSRGNKIINWQAQAMTHIAFDNEKMIAGISKSSPSVNSNNSSSATRDYSLESWNKGSGKTEIEIDTLFKKFCEDPQAITVISMYPDYYNYLEKCGLIDFSDNKKNEIENLVRSYLKEKDIPVGKFDRWYKKFGVIELFKERAGPGKKSLFELSPPALHLEDEKTKF